MLDLVRRHAHGAVFDVAVGLADPGGVDAVGVLLVGPRQGDDVFRQGRGEQQGAALGGRGVEDEFEVFLEAEVEHLVGLVQHHDLEGGKVEVTALQVVAQASRRADHEVGAQAQVALLAARIHAADAGHNDPAGGAVEPAELARDLQRQFPRRRDGQHQRGGGRTEALGLTQDGWCNGQAIGDRLAGSGLGRNQQVAVVGAGGQDRGSGPGSAPCSPVRPGRARGKD